MTTTQSNSLNRTALLGLIFLLIGSFLLMQGVFERGIQADEGVHLTVARELADGKVIYRDLFENRTPGGEWLLAIFVSLGAPTLETGRLLSVGVTLISWAALLLLVSTWVNHFYPQTPSFFKMLFPLLAASLFFLSPLLQLWAPFFMLEGLMTGAALLSALFLTKGILAQTGFERAAAWFFSGLWLAGSILFKQSALVTGAAFFVIVLIASAIRFRRDNGVWVAALSWFGGIALPLLLAGGWLALRGGLSGFFQLASGADRLAPFFSAAEKGSVFWGWVQGQPLIVLALVGGLIILQALRETPQADLPLLLLPAVWFGAELTAIFLPETLDLSWGGGSHYILPTLAAGAWLSGCTLAQAWCWFSEGRYLRPIFLLLLLLPTFWGWGSDLHYVWRVSDYPMADQQNERQIGRVLNAFSSNGEGALVFGNAAYYLLAEQAPAARFFHYPAFLGRSDLAEAAEQDLLPVIRRTGPEPLNALLVSRLHLDFRLPEIYVGEIWSSWEPVSLFQYPYQQDVFLFVPRTSPVAQAESAATFGGGIALNGMNVTVPVENELLVDLIWLTEAEISEPYTMFVHVLNREGMLVAQHDGQPGSGFRPTPSWRPGEPIRDYHWVSLPEGVDQNDLRLSIGLYHGLTGERLPLADGSKTAFEVELSSILNVGVE
ncbi:MAG: hypothetical protein AAF633_01765 [Chloroflexota bacterium]